MDDYCPRERRLTNHAIVAVIGDDIKQTRCSTCEAEHPYKDSKAPRRRKKDGDGELYDQVLAGVTGQLVVKSDEPEDAPAAEVAHPVPPPVRPPVPPPVHRSPVVMPVVAPVVAGAAAAAPAPPAAPDVVEAYVTSHRPLIRATLPRAEGQAPPVERRVTEFTVRQPGSRGGHGFRSGHQGGQGGWQDRGNQAPRHGGGRGDGQGNGFRPGQPDAEGNATRPNGAPRRSRRRRHGKRPPQV